MDAHTPGPWKVANGSLYAQWSVPGQWHGLPSSEANLRLQAAAPDLLAALERMVKVADDEAPRSPKGSPMFMSDLGRAHSEARAAIAKARGAA